MEQRRSPNSPPADDHEPIRSPWLFAVLLLLVLAGTPLWYPTGLVEPLVLGVPLWFAVAVLSTLAFAGFTSWICLRRWNLAESDEAAAAAGEAAAGGDDR